MGDGPGCANLAIAYQTGRGVGKDEAKGVALHRKACGMGWGASCDYIQQLSGLYR